MAKLIYALIAYLPGRLGRFVDEQRERLNPEYASALAHITVLTPRPLPGPPEAMLELLRKHCSQMEPFDVSIACVATFWPSNGVVYLSFSQGADRLVALHTLLNAGELATAEPYPFVPHLTIAQDLDEAGAHAALAAVSREWSEYEGETTFRIETLCLVQQAEGHRWVNLAPIPFSSFYYASRP